MRFNEINNLFLRSHALFQHIPDEILKDITSKFEFLNIETDTNVYTKGDIANFLYIIHSGSVVEILTNNDGNEISAIKLKSGSCFGFFSSIEDETYMTTSLVKKESKLFVLSKKELYKLIEKYPSFNKNFSRILLNRIQSFIKFFEEEKITSGIEIEEVKKNGKELSILTKATELMSSEEPEIVLKIITEEMKIIMNADACFVFLLDSLTGELILEAASGKGETSIKKAKIKLTEGITGWVARSGKPEVIEDMKYDSRVKFISEIKEEDLTSLLSVPLKERGKIIGAINIGTISKRKFSLSDINGAVILANHIALAVSNSRLRRKVEAIAGKAEEIKTIGGDRFVGKTAYVKKINSFIESASKNDNPILIEGEEGIGKTFMARLIHNKSKRQQGPFLVVDCHTFKSESWGEELFGIEKNDAMEGSAEKHGNIELADGGTILLRNVDTINKVNQVKLYNFLRDGIFNRIKGNKILKSNVRIITTLSEDIKNKVKEEIYNKNLYAYLIKNTFHVVPLRKRRKDIPILVEYMLEKLRWELNKSIRKISHMAMERLLSYDWPGNIAELENVLRRAVILTKQDKILSEQIFFGLPRIERKWEFNLLSVEKIKEFLINKSYPKALQQVNLILFFILLLVLLFESTTPITNSVNLMIWSAGWFFLYISALVVGRAWCGVCPFSAIGDWFKKTKSFSLNVPKNIITHSNTVLTFTILLFFWIEGVSNITHKPIYTFYLLLSIPIGAIFFSILYDRHVWCRYFCPLGGLLGIYSIFSFLTLRANRKICLSQCQTHECYKGGTVDGCPLFLHPYGLENNQHCVLCANCLKNCNYNSIHLPFRMPFAQTPYKESSDYIYSYFSLMLNGVLLVENGSILSKGSQIYIQISNQITISDNLLYTILFLTSTFFPLILFFLLNKLLFNLSWSNINSRAKEFGYAFLPLALLGHIAFYLKRIILEGRGFGKGVEMLYDMFHIGKYRLGSSLLIEVFLILAGTAGSLYILYQTNRKFLKKNGLKKSHIKGEVILLSILMFFYFTIVCL